MPAPTAPTAASAYRRKQRTEHQATAPNPTSKTDEPVKTQKHTGVKTSPLPRIRVGAHADTRTRETLKNGLTRHTTPGDRGRPATQQEKYPTENNTTGKRTDNEAFTPAEHSENAHTRHGIPMSGDSCAGNRRSHVYTYTPDGSWACTSCGRLWTTKTTSKDLAAHADEAISLTVEDNSAQPSHTT